MILTTVDPTPSSGSAKTHPSAPDPVGPVEPVEPVEPVGARTSLPTPTTAERYADLSRRRARQGDVRRAQLAAWAGDVHVLEELLWENGLGEAPDPYAQLAAIGESVASAIEAIAADAPDDLTPREVVELARHAMITTFDPSVHDLLHERLGELAHLDEAVPTSTPAATTAAPTSAEDRLAGRTPEALVTDLRATAADCMAVAQLMAGEGEPAAAVRMARQSDAAAFEAYLVSAAIGAGDVSLATVDLRWQLAAEAEDELAGAPAATEPGLDELHARRDLLSSLVGAAERRVLDGLLERW